MGSQSSEFCISVSQRNFLLCPSSSGRFYEKNTEAKAYLIPKALNLTEIEGVFHGSSAKETPISSL